MDLNAFAQVLGRAIRAGSDNSSRGGGNNKAISPPKCFYVMSTEDYRRWKRSMSDWIKISNHSRELAVMNIRLTCEDKLQSAIDAQFTEDDWAGLTVEEAFEAVRKITTKNAAA